MSQDNHAAGYRQFRKALQDGILRPGMIVTQNELCSMLGLSLTPLRETLVLLEEFGLVEVKNRTGIRIVYPEVAFIRENFQFRSLIELHAIRTFTPTASPAWLAEMLERHQHVLREAGNGESRADIDEFLQLDSDLHTSFVNSLENHAISAVYARIMDNINLARQVHDRTAMRRRVKDSAQEHLAILAGVEKGDADEAAAKLEVHFRSSTYRTIVAA